MWKGLYLISKILRLYQYCKISIVSTKFFVINVSSAKPRTDIRALILLSFQMSVSHAYKRATQPVFVRTVYSANYGISVIPNVTQANN
jgi:hypothetical protein